jgi:hypothetical protein
MSGGLAGVSGGLARVSRLMSGVSAQCAALAHLDPRNHFVLGGEIGSGGGGSPRSTTQLVVWSSRSSSFAQSACRHLALLAHLSPPTAPSLSPHLSLSSFLVGTVRSLLVAIGFRMRHMKTKEQHTVHTSDRHWSVSRSQVA